MSFWRNAAAGLSAWFAVVAPAMAADWDVMKASTNFAVVSLDDAELKARQIEKIALGDVELPTGKVVAADPLVQPERPPFVRSVKPGRYPVTLYRAQGRIAVAVMRFAEGAPAKWELATVAGQDTSELKDDQAFGYGVDAGLGCYMDASAFPLMEAREKLVATEKGTDDINYYDDVLAEELRRNNDDYALHKPMQDSAVNVAIFSSGWGDGYYPVFWGLDADGEPLVMMTEFYVLENADGRPSEPGPSESEQ